MSHIVVYHYADCSTEVGSDRLLDLIELAGEGGSCDV